MKNAILFFLIGAIAGGYAMHVYHQRGDAPPVDRARQAASGLGDDLGQKLREWHLTPDDIRSDLDRSGEVVRANARVAGDKITDARILTVIKAKLVLDRDLSARDIAVRVDNGHVFLTGTVPSADHIGRAVALALDTDGVRNVAARLVVLPKT